VGTVARAERELNEQEEAFCAEYARCWSPLDAGRKIGICDATTRKWMKDPAIRWRIRELAKEYAAEVHVEAGALLREMIFLANFDPLDLFTDDGQLKELRKLPMFARKAIREFQVETEYVGEDPSGLPISRRIVKVKLHPKEKALEMLGKFAKLFTDDEQDKTKRVSITINAK
jgi:hypothetical protein